MQIVQCSTILLNIIQLIALHSRTAGTLLCPLILAPSLFLFNNFSILCVVPFSRQIFWGDWDKEILKNWEITLCTVSLHQTDRPQSNKFPAGITDYMALL